jgi:hypothetical protein
VRYHGAVGTRTSELKLPTMAVGVRLALNGSEPSDVEMFVPEVAGRGHGQLLDALAAQVGAEARFLPVRSASRVRLLAKQAISWIAVARFGPDEPLPSEPTEIPEELTLFDHQHFVEVELAHGNKLIGTLLDSAPADHSRVGDHLNQSRRWLRLWTTDQHYLINVQQVVAVTELGEVWG